MRREPNAATEEALAKSRGNRAHRSWKVKQANAALARDREEEEYETSRETSSEDPNMYDFPLVANLPPRNTICTKCHYVREPDANSRTQWAQRK